MKKHYSSTDINHPPLDYNKINDNISFANTTNFIFDNINNDNNLNYDSIDNLNSTRYNVLQKQNQNLKNQIIILTKRIKEYENDYINNNYRKANQLKEFSELESDLNNEINKKNEIINSMKEENNYLKNYINQMDNDINMLKEEVKNLLLENREKENRILINSRQEINNNNNNIEYNNLIELVKKYSNEIIYLKKQNSNLINNLNMINNNNKNIEINDEIKKIKFLQNQEKIGFDNFLNDFIKQINEELFVISQWIETYLGNEYDKGYEIPSLTNDLIDKNNIHNDKIKLINFDLIKSSLEKSATQLNSIINDKDTEIIRLTNIIKEKDNKYNEINKEIIKMKQKQIDLYNEKDQLLLQQEQERKNVLINKNIINNLKQSDENNKNNKIKYLKYLYQIIYKEINSILSDINFRAYHDKFININQNENIFNEKEENNINFFEEKLNISLIKLIEFIEELKYDYIQTKNENVDIMKEKARNTKNIIINNADNNKIDEYKSKIEELRNNNKILKEQINIINKNNELKLIKDDEIMMKCENIENENKNLRYNNDNLLNKLKKSNDDYLLLEKENNELKRKIKKINSNENDDYNLKQKINDLSIDYQRILKENTTLKNLLNSQNFSNF